LTRRGFQGKREKCGGKNISGTRWGAVKLEWGFKERDTNPSKMGKQENTKDGLESRKKSTEQQLRGGKK